MGNEKKLVEQITSQEQDFAKWYTDVCLKAELCCYSGTKGFVVLRPYGYALWENIIHGLDARFKEKNVKGLIAPSSLKVFLTLKNSSWSSFGILTSSNIFKMVSIS